MVKLLNNRDSRRKMGFKLSSDITLRSYKMGLAAIIGSIALSYAVLPDILERKRVYDATTASIQSPHIPKSLSAPSFAKSLEDGVIDLIEAISEPQDDKIIKAYKEFKGLDFPGKILSTDSYMG